MVLSEAEAEKRLERLRRQREAIDRTITDLALYLELGRRLGGVGGAPSTPEMPAEASRSGELGSGAAGIDAAHVAPATGAAAQAGERAVAPGRDGSQRPGEGGSGDATSATGRSPEAEPPSPAAEDPADGAAARRYGRALVQAAVSVLEDAGRPLHVGEILAALSERGFAIPGHQDPVAALNTRLWKRSGPGGSVRRLGDAVYALPDADQSRA